MSGEMRSVSLSEAVTEYFTLYLTIEFIVPEQISGFNFTPFYFGCMPVVIVKCVCPFILTDLQLVGLSITTMELYEFYELSMHAQLLVLSFSLCKYFIKTQ